jgi:NADPH:quinone reductase-like Zn-dependent oxidoreductase
VRPGLGEHASTLGGHRPTPAHWLLISIFQLGRWYDRQGPSVPQDAKNAAASDLSEAAAQSALSVAVAEVFPLARIAAHEFIESGSARGRVLVSLP